MSLCKYVGKHSNPPCTSAKAKVFLLPILDSSGRIRGNETISG